MSLFFVFVLCFLLYILSQLSKYKQTPSVPEFANAALVGQLIQYGFILLILFIECHIHGKIVIQIQYTRIVLN